MGRSWCGDECFVWVSFLFLRLTFWGLTFWDDHGMVGFTRLGVLGVVH
jgi:hypothetical protein